MATTFAKRSALGYAVFTALLGASALSQPAAAKTIALALGDIRVGIYEEKGAKAGTAIECPDGFTHDSVAQYNAAFPSQEAREYQQLQFGYYHHSGAQGQNRYHYPMSAEAPLPFRTVKSKLAYGLNLDGETEGKGTSISFPHENFTSPEGEKGIDNQLYRVLGCAVGWRAGGMVENITRSFQRSEFEGRLLIEIADVDDETNDNDVTVYTYRGRDPIVVESTGKILPWISQRVDYKGGAHFMQRFKGKIVNGVLETTPQDGLLPTVQFPGRGAEFVIRQLRFRLALTPEGAEGLAAGYEDVEQWYYVETQYWGGHAQADIQGFDGPSFYRAMYKYADFRDPVTGEPTGISNAYQMRFARVFLLDVDRPKIEAVVEQNAKNFATRLEYRTKLNAAKEKPPTDGKLAESRKVASGQ